MMEQTSVVVLRDQRVEPNPVIPSSGTSCHGVGVTQATPYRTVKKCDNLPPPHVSAESTTCSVPLVTGNPSNVLLSQAPIGNNMYAQQQQNARARSNDARNGNTPGDESANQGYLLKSLEFTSTQNNKERTVFFSLTFSLAGAEANPKNASKCIQNKRVFDCRAIGHTDTNIKVSADLATSVITRVQLLSLTNSHKVPFAASITGVKGNCYTIFGDNYSFFIPANIEGAITFGNSGLDIFKPRKMDSTYLSMYGGLTKESIWNGIFEVPGQPEIAMVVHNHAVVKVLQMNAQQGIIPQNDVEKLLSFKYRDMYEIPKSFVEDIAWQIVEQALENMPYINLADFAIQLHRADVPLEQGTPHYTSTDGTIAESEHEPSVREDWLRNNYTVSAEIKVTYFVASAKFSDRQTDGA